MTRREYRVPMVGTVGVDADKGTLDLTVEIHQLPDDLAHDYSHDPNSPTLAEDAEAVREILNAHPLNFLVKHTLSK